MVFLRYVADLSRHYRFQALAQGVEQRYWAPRLRDCVVGFGGLLKSDGGCLPEAGRVVAQLQASVVQLSERLRHVLVEKPEYPVRYPVGSGGLVRRWLEDGVADLFRGDGGVIFSWRGVIEALQVG